MTRDELNRKRMMFQIYANRNKMPQLQKNDNEEPIAHSATNDFLEYRKKVAAGMRMQRENNKSNLFNVTAANEQYHQDLMDQNIIIHAGMNNQYIAKLDDFYGKGKPRYFYDQTEWDNYRKNMQGAGQANAQRGAKEGADAKNKALANKAQQAFTNTNRNSALNTAQSRREEEVQKSQKDLYNKALASEALKGKNGAIVNRMTSLGKAQSGRESAINNSESFVKSSDNEKSKTPEIVQEAQSGRENAIKRSDPKYQKELEKAKSIKEDKDRWGAYSESDLKEISKDKRFSNIKTEDDAVNYPGGVEKLYNDLEAALEEKFPGKKKNYEATKNAGADRAAKESAVEKEKEAKAADRAKKLEEQQNKKEEAAKSGTKTTESYTEQVKKYTDAAKDIASKNDDGSLDEAGKDYINWVKEESLKNLNSPEFYQIKKDVVKDAKKPGATVKDLANKYGLEEAYINYLVFNATGKNIPEDKDHLDARRTTNALYNKWSKEGAINRSKKGIKHSSLEDGITTSDDITPDQEYLNFRARVEAGIKHFGMTRGLMTIPVNQALKNGESLSHAGMTNKYYAKLDDFWGKGKPRYFYSKEEWDGYQRNKQGAAQAGSDRAKKEKEEASKIETKSYSDKKFENDLKNKGLAEAADNAYQKAYRNNLLNRAQSGREAAINNSSPLANSSSNNPVKKFANKLIDAINNKGTSDKVVTTVIVEDNTPEIVQKAQSGREAAEKEATKRTMTTMAYNKAVKDYQEVAKEIDKEYGFDKLDPTDSKAVNKTWQKLIKDTAKVIDSGKVDNPNNVKYEYQLKDDDANSYAWAAYIQDYASENLRLNSIYNDLQNEYSTTLQNAQAMRDFDAIAEANRHASELFDQMENVRDQMNELKKESDAKVLPYLTAVYRELI